MPRITQKRRRSSFARRPFKRRRIIRNRKRVANGNYTSLATRGQVTGFRSRRTSRRVYRNHLWQSSLFANHYRSVGAITSTITTLPSTVLGSVTGLNLYRHGTNAFWTVPGGLQPHDFGVTTAVFGGDLTIRGGRWNVTFFNDPASNVDVKIKIFILNSVNQPNFSFEPATAPVMWDPTASPDFVNFIGKPYKAVETLLEAGHSWSIGGTIRLQKVDQITYVNQGRSPIMFVHAYNIGVTTAHSIVVTRSFNLSFSGDTQ